MKIIKPGGVLGIMGGGQLGKMTANAASTFGLRVHVYTDSKDSPAAHVADKVTVASYKNKKALEKFAKSVDVVTFEFENIPLKTVEYIANHTIVRPGVRSLEIAQHRLKEKDFLNQIGVKTAPYRKVTSVKTLQAAYRAIGPHCILKTVELGYDGKGQTIIDENTNLTKLWNSLKLKMAILEQKVPFEKELSVIIARTIDGGSLPYNPSENIHQKGILDISMAPAQIDEKLTEKIWEIAAQIADKLELVGILAVEFFLTKGKELLVNEIAPRPHNSGHWTLDACITSQFEQLVRAVCGWPLGSSYHHSHVLMKNLIGNDIELWEEFIKDPDTKVHIYGKKEARPGRKMGHVTHLLSPEDSIVLNKG